MVSVYTRADSSLVITLYWYLSSQISTIRTAFHSYANAAIKRELKYYIFLPCHILTPIQIILYTSHRIMDEEGHSLELGERDKGRGKKRLLAYNIKKIIIQIEFPLCVFEIRPHPYYYWVAFHSQFQLFLFHFYSLVVVAVHFKRMQTKCKVKGWKWIAQNFINISTWFVSIIIKNNSNKPKPQRRKNIPFYLILFPVIAWG